MVGYGGEEMLARDLPPLQKAKYESIMNVYRDAGIGAEMGTVKFNEWTDDERDGFRDLREQLPNEPAAKFVAYYQSMVEANRANAPVEPEPEPKPKPYTPISQGGDRTY